MVRCFAAAVILTAVLFLSACGGASSVPTRPSSDTMSAVAHAYVDEFLGIMQIHSINRYKIEWALFRSMVYQSAGGAQTVRDVVAGAAISTALAQLGDHHSQYIAADGTYIHNPVPVTSCFDRKPEPVSVPDGIGYVKVGAFSGQADAALQFALSIQNQVMSADNDRIAGWIVDTRGNSGGNMWPMIAGVGPVLGEGLAGAFIDPDGNVTRWGYTQGAAWSDNESSAIVAIPAPYRLLRPNPRVAVLADCGVASSGEAVVLAFRARPNTRSFGTPTLGVSTSNTRYALSDGATLILTNALMADRTYAPYGQAIVPDEVISDPAQAVTRAVEWLLGQ